MMNFNTFDLTNEEDISLLSIKATYSRDICFIQNQKGDYFNKFILDKNTQSKVICEITFYPSSQTGKFIPRPILKKINNDGKDKESTKTIINLSDSEVANRFWVLISFLNNFKDLVDTGTFEKTYQIIKEDYLLQFTSKNEQQKVEMIKELVEKANFQEKDIIKALTLSERRKNLRAFYFLLTNKYIEEKTSMQKYQEKYNLKGNGDEIIWHHFFKQHEWILGLNINLIFIRDLLDEQNTGIETGQGKESPKVDFLGISNFTTLIELKTPKTLIFKEIRGSKARANTWEFSNDFIAGISQCLGQKSALEKSYNTKKFETNDGYIIDKEKIRTLDPDVVFIIGHRNREFPHDNQSDSILKSETFERFRRNSKHVNIVTFDELFERAYYIVIGEKIDQKWYLNDNFHEKLQ